LRNPAKLPGPAAEILGVDAERGPAPIDVGVEIDQPRRDDAAGNVAHVGFGIRAQSRPNANDLTARKCNIGHGIELLRGIDHAAAAQDEVVAHRILRARHLSSAINRAA